MRTLEQIKKEKNFKANIKGYPIDPEGFPKWFLIQRIYDEFKKLGEILKDCNDYYEMDIDNLVMDEMADISNFIDYLATKIVVDYPDRYDPDEIEG